MVAITTRLFVNSNLHIPILHPFDFSSRNFRHLSLINMDEDSPTHEHMADIDYTDMDVVMQEYAPEDERSSPPDSHSLEELPSELIGMIAEYLPKKDLRSLQALGSRNILQAIDHVLVSENSTPPDTRVLPMFRPHSLKVSLIIY
jgi:hypothetical protein